MAARDYLMVTSIRIEKRGKFSVTAAIDHPDGLTALVKCKLFYDEGLILETQRRSGDALDGT